MDVTKAKNYQWLVKNSWKFGFLRTVKSEEWHFEYWPELAKKGPYAKLSKTNELYYSDLGINNLQIS
jgi:Gpi18-like mannosyltransferase